jgi:hypothetical protein
MTEEIHPTSKEIAESIDRIARTTDGANLYVLLQRSLMYVPATAKAGALRCQHGERMFASKLIGLMAKGIHESGGRTFSTSDPSTGSGSGSEQPIVVPVARPVAGPRAARDRARADRISAIAIGGSADASDSGSDQT